MLVMISAADMYRFGQLAGLLRRIENFVVEDRKVESQSQANGVGGLHF